MKSMPSVAEVLLTTILTVQSVWAETPISVLLERGIHAEETEGDLDAAIATYRGIVEEASANRPLVAEAHYRLGTCYLRKAKAEFGTLVEHFSDCEELAAKARVHLAAQPEVSSEQADTLSRPISQLGAIRFRLGPGTSGCMPRQSGGRVTNPAPNTNADTQFALAA